MDHAPAHTAGVQNSGHEGTRVVMVTGSRESDVEHAVQQALNDADPAVVLVGCCPTGADYAARVWCERHAIPCPVLHASWARYGNAAGPKRNTQLVRVASMLSAKVLAFPRGRSPGTRDCMRKAAAAGLEVREL